MFTCPIESNFSIIEKFENNISGIIWIAGKSGEADEEFSDPKKCETNIRINFLNPVLIINKIIPKMKFEKKSFIAVLTSVAALRGRSKRLFYASAKSGLTLKAFAKYSIEFSGLFKSK
jgi:NAD(P)-dependent dehydrogenase (short-subunit alcohol dehydrogenase family)